MSEDWVGAGDALVRGILVGLDAAAFAAPSALPGWSRATLTAHLIGNAEALSNLVRWAATGEETPMYASMEQRNADIEARSKLSAAELTTQFAVTADALADAMGALTEDQWQAPVRTFQGRTVPATEIAWMRAREVLVHAVDYDAGTGFADLPSGFCRRLGDEIAAKRSSGGPALDLRVDEGGGWTVPGDGEPAIVTGPLAELVAYLAGRPTAVTGPTLPAWL